MLLKIESLRGGYGDIDVVKDISCAADKGEIVCLVGPNGCGKTTLFRLILDLIPATSGSIQIDSKCTKELSTRELASLIAYVPQHHAPIFSYTSLDIVIMGRASHFSAFDAPKSIDRDAAFDALEKLNIVHLANRKYTSLSGGERQMVLISRALCQAAKVIVMDEPGANLDYANQQLLMDVITDLAAKGYCIIMSTHSPEHPISIGHKTLLMKQGDMVAFGKSSDVITAENLRAVYGIEMDVVTVNDRYGAARSICIPVKKRKI